MSDSEPRHTFSLAPGTKLEKEASEAADKLRSVMFDYEGVIREDTFEMTMDLAAGTVKVQSYVDHVAVGKLQVLGVWNKSKETWTWALDLAEYPDSLTKAARKTQKKLLDQGLDSLQTTTVRCGLVDACLIAALAWKWNRSDLQLFDYTSDDFPFILIDDIEIVKSEE